MADITNCILTLNTDFTTKTSRILLRSLNFSLYSYCVRPCSTVAIHLPVRSRTYQPRHAYNHLVLLILLSFRHNLTNIDVHIFITILSWYWIKTLQNGYTKRNYTIMYNWNIMSLNTVSFWNGYGVSVSFSLVRLCN